MENVILVHRLIDCSKISEQDFISIMSEDLNKSVIEYNAYWRPIYEEDHKKSFEEYRKNVRKRFEECAIKKWKTEKKRIAYVESKMAEIQDQGYYYPTLTFFDMDVEPGKNGISGACVINIDKPNLKKCWEAIKDNKYFRSAMGWILEDHHHARPQIKLVLPDDMQVEFDSERKNLEKAISEFYRGTHYFGD